MTSTHDNSFPCENLTAIRRPTADHSSRIAVEAVTAGAHRGRERCPSTPTTQVWPGRKPSGQTPLARVTPRVTGIMRLTGTEQQILP
jgi:hypothetical protein